MELNEKLKEIPTHLMFGVECWTPTGAAIAIDAHRNTIIAWARKTAQGKLNMPMYRAPVRGSDIHIPIQEFMEWFGYTQN